MECDAMFDCCDGVLIKKTICKKKLTLSKSLYLMSYYICGYSSILLLLSDI